MTDQQREMRDWLNQLRFLRVEIAELEATKQEAWDSATRIVSQLTGMPGSQSKNPHKFERYSEIDGNLTELIEEKNKALQERLEVVSAVEDARLRLLLTARYINCKSWEGVYAVMGYQSTPLESDYVFKLHRKALDRVWEIRENIMDQHSET